MKTKNIIRLSAAYLAAAICLTGCSDDFLKDKKDYNKTTPDLYNTYEGAKGRIDNLYSLMLPVSTSGVTYDFPSAGTNDVYSQSTEEYSSLSVFVDEGTILTTNSSSLPGFFHEESRTSRNPYGRIRNCNDAIEGINNSSLTQTQKEELLGQAHFFRAWTYYRLVKVYGGVPIITEVQNAIIGDSGGESLAFPRATTKECIDFICNDLQLASEYLPERWADTDYGRVTAGAALALQGRARLLYASPLFNRSDDKARWETAYQSNKNAISKLISGGFGLAYLDDPGINASGWGKMFSDYVSPEAVFVTLYNSIKSASGIQPNKNNGWENSIRPVNTGASGGKAATDLIVDLFPMADGLKPGKSIHPYNQNLFMLNRDPRFYRTFAFPGVRWAFSGDPTSKGAAFPYGGSVYELWNYAWYDTDDKKTALDQSGYGADGLGTNYKGVYIRKRTDDLDINRSTLYDYDLNNGTRPFEWSAAPYMEIRYAEVLLNFAEAACGADHYADALEALQQIRKRVGYTAADNYGLEPGIAGNRAKLFAAILYERQVELAYEGKRFDDMRRWMLWDGGEGQSSLNSSWVLTGFGGNTCNYLGVDPFNGKRRDIIELRVSDAINGGLANANQASDPVKADRPAAWNLATEASASTDLVDFYRDKLIRKLRQGDDIKKSISFRPQYYFIGLKSNAQSNNKTLKQTIGWQDIMNGSSNGTFDPLAE